MRAYCVDDREYVDIDLEIKKVIPKDIVGQEIKVGQRIAYAQMLGRVPRLTLATVIDIMYKNSKGELYTSWRNQEIDGKTYRLTTNVARIKTLADRNNNPSFLKNLSNIYVIGDDQHDYVSRYRGELIDDKYIRGYIPCCSCGWRGEFVVDNAATDQYDKHIESLENE